MRNYVKLLKQLKFNKSNVVYLDLYSYPQRVRVITVVKMLWSHNTKDNERNLCQDLLTIDHFTVVCSVTWPLNGSEAGGDLVLIQTSLLLF